MTGVATQIVEIVRGVSGVRGIEPGLGTTLRGLDALLRRGGNGQAVYGVTLDPDTAEVVVEVSLTGRVPARDVVTAIQRAVQDHAARVGLPEQRVLVRVQSVIGPDEE